MKVNVLFFGATADAAGTRETEFETGENESAKNVFAEILDSFPNLQNYGRSLLFSVNQEYSDGTEPIKDGDELAIFTAVSGG